MDLKGLHCAGCLNFNVCRSEASLSLRLPLPLCLLSNSIHSLCIFFSPHLWLRASLSSYSFGQATLWCELVLNSWQIQWETGDKKEKDHHILTNIINPIIKINSWRQQNPQDSCRSVCMRIRLALFFLFCFQISVVVHLIYEGKVNNKELAQQKCGNEVQGKKILQGMLAPNE